MENLTARREAQASLGELNFLWIENDGLLRDEGVVFGLAGDREGLARKEECIRAYYRRWIAEDDRRRAAIESEMRDTVVAGSAPTPPRPEGDDAGALAFRHLAGIVAASAACVGTGVLVYEQLRGSFVWPGAITMGVVAAGFFTTFLPISLLFTSDRGDRQGGVELWKVRLAEFGLPLASAAFVVSWGWDRLGPARSAATLVLLFLAFTFAGRQLLSSIPWLGGAVRRLRSDRIAAIQAVRAAGEEAARAERRASLHRELGALRSQAEWEAIRDAKLALFMSEYELASAPARHTSRLAHVVPVPSLNGIL
jgi:hypothetical protein